MGIENLQTQQLQIPDYKNKKQSQVCKSLCTSISILTLVMLAKVQIFLRTHSISNDLDFFI